MCRSKLISYSKNINTFQEKKEKFEETDIIHFSDDRENFPILVNISRIFLNINKVDLAKKYFHMANEFYGELDVEEKYRDDYFRNRGIYKEIEHPVVGKEILIEDPWQFSDPIPNIHHSAPLVGQHNHYVYGELLGFSKEKIKELMEKKVIY